MADAEIELLAALHVALDSAEERLFASPAPAELRTAVVLRMLCMAACLDKRTRTPEGLNEFATECAATICSHVQAAKTALAKEGFSFEDATAAMEEAFRARLALRRRYDG